MKNSKVLKGYLFLSGLMLTGLGVMILFNPVEFKMSGGVDIGTDVNVVNDVRAGGALLLGSGLTILLGIFISALTFTSNVIAILVFLSYGIGRAISIVSDGMPVDSLFKATIAEFVIAGLGIFMLMKYRNSEG